MSASQCRLAALVLILMCVMISGLVSSPINAQTSSPSATFTLYLPTVRKQVEIIPPLPSNLETVNTLGGKITAVAVAGHFAYIGEGAGLSVIDVSDSEHPRFMSRLPLTLRSYINEITIEGTRAYLAAGKDGLLIVDIANTFDPQLVGTFATETPVSGVRVAGMRWPHAGQR